MKLCIFCNNCEFNQGWIGSSFTPGYSASVSCVLSSSYERGVPYRGEAPNDDREKFIKWNKYAETCLEYETDQRMN